jgi:NADH dehydrogenase [ubiquinone] 1 alpha subcomplex assembly factor 5
MFVLVNIRSLEKSLHRDPDTEFEGMCFFFKLTTPSHRFFQVQVERINADEEHFLSVVGHDSQQAIVSCLSLHWVNDLPGSRSSTLRHPIPRLI